MDLVKLLYELRQEAASINEAMATIERLIRVSGKRRGRPPKIQRNLSLASSRKAHDYAPVTREKSFPE
jgi:hypothetical protein